MTQRVGENRVPISPPRGMAAYRRPYNFLDLLVHTQMKTAASPTDTGSTLCNSKRCKTCQSAPATFSSHARYRVRCQFTFKHLYLRQIYFSVHSGCHSKLSFAVLSHACSFKATRDACSHFVSVLVPQVCQHQRA